MGKCTNVSSSDKPQVVMAVDHTDITNGPEQLVKQRLSCPVVTHVQ